VKADLGQQENNMSDFNYAKRENIFLEKLARDKYIKGGYFKLNEA
jgi:hypothetical protein